MQRVATISESNGRASVFLGAVSAGLIALGFESTGSVAVITSVVFGEDAGVIAYGLSSSLATAIGVGSATWALLLGWATWYQWGRWCHASPPPPELAG
jgi:hypothetical protein